VDLTVGAIAAVVMATVVGAALQGALGFGMNLVSVPVLALAVPESLPVTAIILGIPISISMVRYERGSLDRVGVGWIIAGRAPGSAVGALVVATVSTSALQAITGAVVLALVVASVAAPPLRIRRGSQIAAGVVSGVTGTTAGIGGPPLALLYQRSPGPIMRSTLAASFMFGTVLSLGTLGVARQITLGPVLLGACLAPVVVAGAVVGRRLHGVLDRGWLRPVVLVFAGATGLAALLRALVS
jgi:uncharacterized membrane protein YfcA